MYSSLYQKCSDDKKVNKLGLVMFLIIICIQFESSLCTMTLSITNRTINANTSYNLTIIDSNLNTITDATAYLQIVFNSEFFIFNIGQSFPCLLSDNPLTSYNCIASTGNIIRIANPLFTNSSIFRISILNIKNPPYTVKITFTYNFRYSNTNIIRTLTSPLYSGYLPGVLQSCTTSFSPSNVFTQSLLTITIRLGNQIPRNGSIFVDFSSKWIDQANDTYNAFMKTTTRNCLKLSTDTILVSPLSCVIIAPVIALLNSLNSNAPSGTTLSFSISSIFTPPTTSGDNFFIIRTQTQTNDYLVDSSSCSVPSMTTRSIIDIIPMSSHMIGATNSIILTFISPTSMMSGDSLIISSSAPNNTFFALSSSNSGFIMNDSTIALLQRDSSSTTSNARMSFISSTSILLQNVKFQIKQGFLVQPLITSGKRSLLLSLRRNNSLIALNSFQLDVQPNILQSLNISLNTYTVSTLATYTFSFNLFNSLAIRSKVVIILPSQISIINGPCTASILLTSITSLNSSATCQVTASRTITISSINIVALNPGQKITISISNILNSQVAQQTNPFIISTYFGDTITTPTDTNTNTKVTMTPQIIGTATISSSNPTVAVQSVYTLAYTVRVKFFANFVVQLKLPSQISFGLNAISAVFNIKYPNSTTTLDQSCSVTNSTISQVQYLKFIGISSLQLASNTIITIKISSLINPPSLKPSTSFGLYQLDSIGNQVQKLESGLSITNSQTNLFNPIFLVENPIRVNGQQSILTISFQTRIGLKINDYFQVQFQITNNLDSQLLFSNPLTTTDILYSDNANTIKINYTFQRRSSTLIRIDLKQSLQPGKTYQLALNTIIRSRSAQTPSTITLRSFQYVTSTISFGISSSLLNPSSNNKQNVIPKISLKIITFPSQLFSFQQFQLKINTKNQFLTGDYVLIEIPNIYLFFGTILSITPTTDLIAIASQSLCIQNQLFCSHHQLNPNIIRVQQVSPINNPIFNNIFQLTATIKNNLYRSPSTFNYKGYYFNGKTYSSNNRIIDGSTGLGSPVTDYSSAEFYLSCNISQSDYHCRTCNSNGTCTACYQTTTINSTDYTLGGFKYLTSDQKCVADCTNGYYINNNTNICTKCDSPCLTCQNIGTKCLSCIQNIITNKYYSVNNTCLNTCPSTHYSDSANICIICSSNCFSCIDNGFKCTSCTGTTFLNPTTITCVNSTNCQSGTYADINQNKCLPCDNSCSGCITTAINCVLCTQGYIQDLTILTYRKCTNQCPVGTVNDTANSLGCRCETQCKTCSVTTSKCTTCNLLSQFIYLYSDTCVSICPQGTYIANINTVNTCQVCAETNCKTCSFSGCSQCSGTFLLYEGACITQCPAISVLTITSGIRTCLRCLIGCINCDKGINQCNTCQSGYLKQGNNTNTYCTTTCSTGYVNFNNIQCYTSCPAGYQSVNNVCSWPNGVNPINTVNSQISTTKTVPFPFLISAVILISSVILCKVVLPYSLASTMITGIIGVLQVLSWIVIIIVCVVQTSEGKHWSTCQNGVYLLIVALVLNLFLNLLAIFFFFKYIYKDPKFSRMIVYNNKKALLGKCPIFIIFILSMLLSHKLLGVIFSNFLGSRHFSYKVNTVTNLVPLNYILFSSIIVSILAIAGGSVISYELQNYKTDSGSFIAAVDMIIVTVIAMVACIWVSNRDQKDYQVDIFTNVNGDKNYQTEQIFVQGNRNQDIQSHMNQVFMEQSGVRKTNMSFDKQKNYYYKSSRLSQLDEDHVNNPLTKRKLDKKPINNQGSNILRSTVLSQQHSSQALVIQQSKKRRNLKDQFTPQINQNALNSKQDIQVIQFDNNKNNLNSNTNNNNQQKPLKAIHYPNINKKDIKPQQLDEMSSRQKQQLKQRIRQQLQSLDDTDKQKLSILNRQKQLKIKKKKQKIQQISSMSQKQIQSLPKSQKQKVSKVKNAVDLLKRKKIKIQQYLLYSEIIKQQQGEYDSDSDNHREISEINAKDNKQQNDNDLEQVINLSPKRRNHQNQQSPNKTGRQSLQRDKSNNSKQKTIKKQSHKNKMKSNKKGNKLNDLHVFYKYQQNNGQLNMQGSCDSEQQPQLPKMRSNITNKNKNNMSHKNIDYKKNISREDMMMVDLGSGRYNRTQQGEGLVDDQFSQIVPPKFLHSTQKLQNKINQFNQIKINDYNKNNIFQSQNQKQTKKSFEFEIEDYQKQISPSRFNMQNQRIQYDQVSDLPTRPRIYTTDQGLNYKLDSKNPNKRSQQNDGFQNYDNDNDNNKFQQQNNIQMNSRLNSTNNRHLDYEAILRKNQQNQKLKKLQQIYLPRLQSKVNRKKTKKNNVTSRNSHARDIL